MTSPSGPQVVNGTQTLMIALAELSQSSLAGRLPDVAPGTVFWSATRDAAGLVAGGLAWYASAGTPLARAEPPYTVHGVAGFAAGTSNASP